MGCCSSSNNTDEIEDFNIPKPDYKFKTFQGVKFALYES